MIYIVFVSINVKLQDQTNFKWCFTSTFLSLKNKESTVSGKIGSTWAELNLLHKSNKLWCLQAVFSFMLIRLMFL